MKYLACKNHTTEESCRYVIKKTAAKVKKKAWILAFWPKLWCVHEKYI